MILKIQRIINMYCTGNDYQRPVGKLRECWTIGLTYLTLRFFYFDDFVFLQDTFFIFLVFQHLKVKLIPI